MLGDRLYLAKVKKMLNPEKKKKKKTEKELFEIKKKPKKINKKKIKYSY